MPSRKRNQGKQRKAKAASATSASSEALLQSSEHDDDFLAQLVNNLSLKKCDHGRPTLAGDACEIFMKKFERALVAPANNAPITVYICAYEALQSAADYSHIQINGYDVEQASDCLFALGADFLLEAVAKISNGRKYLIAEACAIASRLLFATHTCLSAAITLDLITKRSPPTIAY